MDNPHVATESITSLEPDPVGAPTSPGTIFVIFAIVLLSIVVGVVVLLAVLYKTNSR